MEKLTEGRKVYHFREVESVPGVVVHVPAPLEEWFKGGDVGSSSLTIASVLGSIPLWLFSPCLTTAIPRDPADLGRCIALLDKVPAWRSRLDEVVEVDPRWGPLVARWGELESLYRSEPSDRFKGKTYELMMELIYE